jgi:pilus assembly protein CpaD
MRMKTYKNAAGLLLAAVTLAGCGMTARDPIQVGSVPDDYRTRHPIVLSEQQQSLDVPIASGTRELLLPVKSNIRAFAANFASAGTGSLFLTMPSGSQNEHAVKRVQNDILTAIADGGASRSRVITQYYDASAYGPSAPIRLSYTAVAASTAPCGNWPADMTDTVENKHYHDYGCSTQANLAAIVDNPGDLLGPRQTSQIDAEQRAAVIKRYQAGPVGAATEVSY